MRKIFFAVLTAVAVLLALTGVSSAVSPAVGTASSTISILSLTAAGKTVNIGGASGLATTDKVRQNLGALSGKAGMSFFAARVLNAVSTPEISVEATSDRPSDAEVDTTSPLLDLPNASGALTITGMRADVDNALPSARSTLGQVTLDADLISGLVSIQGIKVGLTNESNPTEATSLQGIEVSNVFVLPLREIIDRATDLSAEDVINLAAAFGGGATSGELGAVNLAKASLIDTVNAVVPGLLDTTITVDTMLACSAPLLQVICDLPSVATAIASLRGALDTLKSAVGALPLVNLRNVTVGVMAVATDTSSDSTAGISWGSAQVAGLDVPITPADIQASVSAVNTKLGELQTLMNGFTTGLAGLTLKITPPTLNPTKGQSGDYRQAASSITALGVDAALPAAAGISSPLSVSGQLLNLAGDAEHRPSVLGDPPIGRPLAATGANGLWMFAGLMMLVAGCRLRRWLGDAA